jgi:hypothetical protein
MESTEEETLPNNDHWTRNRRELLEWLGKTSPSLAELYKGAVDLLFGRPASRLDRTEQRFSIVANRDRPLARMPVASARQRLGTIWEQ